jgi:hypothetical protein
MPLPMNMGCIPCVVTRLHNWGSPCCGHHRLAAEANVGVGKDLSRWGAELMLDIGIARLRRRTHFYSRTKVKSTATDFTMGYLETLAPLSGQQQEAH